MLCRGRRLQVPDAFFTLYADLPRLAPGSDDATRRALDAVRPELRPEPVAYDLGCGTGRSALVLARELGAPERARVVAVDRHGPYLEALEAAAGGAVETRCADLLEPGDDARQLDLVWCEGAAYAVGVERAQADWRARLRPGGFAALTELAWLVPDPPAEARAFWERDYPGMRDVAGNLALAEQAGFEPVESFVLPESAWWDEYYGPLEERIARLAPGGTGVTGATGELAEAIAAARREIGLYRRFSASYGYLFLILRSP